MQASNKPGPWPPIGKNIERQLLKNWKFEIKNKGNRTIPFYYNSTGKIESRFQCTIETGFSEKCDFRKLNQKNC
jgi:hypothetical protein